jgi:hypothetical protein
MRIGAAIAATAFFLGACGSSSTLNTGSDDSGTEPVAEQSAPVEQEADDYFEDLPADLYEPPPAGFILEPANAQMEALDGWVDVDEWYWEPISFVPSPDCDALNEALFLEEWGVITAFRLREGTELYHFTADLNTAENVAEYIDAFTSLPSACESAMFDGAALTFVPLQSDNLKGFTMTVDGQVSPNWFFESDTVSSVAITSRNNVVSILQIVPTDDFDMAEFDGLFRRAVSRLDGVPPETRASPDSDLVELEAEVATRTPDCPDTNLTSAVMEIDGGSGEVDAQTAVDGYRSPQNPDWQFRPDWHDLQLLRVQAHSSTSSSFIYGNADGETKLVLEAGEVEGQWYIGGLAACAKAQ